MEGFSRIKEPMRLKRGDILYFPPAAREPRLSVGLSTFSRMGISIGETRRSANHVARVRNEPTGGVSCLYKKVNCWNTLRAFRTER